MKTVKIIVLTPRRRSDHSRDGRTARYDVKFVTLLSELRSYVMSSELEVEAVASASSAPLVIISLDQNALCSMERRAGATISPTWSRIKALLIAGVNQDKLVCPIPFETIWESRPLSEERYRRVSELQTRLSRGVTFKPFFRVLAEETLALVRPSVDIAPFTSGGWPVLPSSAIGDAARREFSKLKRHFENQAAATPVKYDNRSASFAKLEQLVRQKQTSDLYCSLERMQAGQSTAPECAYTSDVCEFLRRNSISGEEIEMLKSLARHHKYEAIPVLFYYTRLLTQLEFDLLRGGRRQEVNDIDDLTRVASALWASDVYVCDKEMADVCRKAKVQEATHTLVFAASRAEEFQTHLEAVVSV